MRRISILLVLIAALALPRLASAAPAILADGAESGLAVAGNQPCTTTATTLCLFSGEFAVTATFRTPEGAMGQAQAHSVTDDTGYFWFFSSSNVEFVIKVVDGCPVNNHFWIFAGGLTNVRVDIIVTDVFIGGAKHYVNRLDTPFAPIQDTAFPEGCPISSARFKRDVASIAGIAGIGDDAGERLMRMRPLGFGGVGGVGGEGGEGAGGGEGQVRYGLIAEEVDKAFPGFVQHDKDGKAVAVSYHFIDALLLDEVQKQRRQADQQRREVEELQRELGQLGSKLRSLEATATVP
jgi:hypothetical protein